MGATRLVMLSLGLLACGPSKKNADRTVASSYDPNPPGCTQLFDRWVATALPPGWSVTSAVGDTTTFALSGEARVTVSARVAWSKCDAVISSEIYLGAPPFFSEDWLNGETVSSNADVLHTRACQGVAEDQASSAVKGALVVEVKAHPSLEKDPRIQAMTQAFNWEGRNASSCMVTATCTKLPGSSRELALPAGWSMTPDPGFAEVAIFAWAGHPDVFVASMRLLALTDAISSAVYNLSCDETRSRMNM